MKFTFKRKYNVLFFVFLLLTLIAVGFYFIGPRYISREQDFFNQVLLISLIDIFLILLFVLGLYRVNYYLYHDHIEIRRSLRKTVNLDYESITQFVEYPNDTIWLMFGKRPSFKIRHKNKNYRIRVADHDLFKLVMENENKIHATENK